MTYIPKQKYAFHGQRVYRLSCGTMLRAHVTEISHF